MIIKSLKYLLLLLCVSSPVNIKFSPKGGKKNNTAAPVAPSAAELAAAEKARQEAERLKILADQRAVHFGDKIVIRSKTAYNTITAANGQSASLALRSAKPDLKFSDATNQLWYVKGKHTKSDPWNCIPGDDVKNGDIVRIESVQHGTNLSCSGSGDSVILVLNGTKGIGSTKDNWKLVAQGGSIWRWGAPFSLINIDTGFVINATAEGGINVIKSLAAKPKSNADEIPGTDDATSKVLQEQMNKADKAQQDASTQPNQTQAKKEAPAKLDTPAPADPQSTTFWVCDAQVAIPPEDDIAWTGSPSGSPAEADDSAMVALEIVKLGMGGGIPPQATQDFVALSADKKPFLSGFARDTIDGFTSGFMLDVSPLRNKGAAWLGESLKTPGRATIQFRAKAEDKGDIQVVFAQDIGIDFAYKIRLGAYDNTKSVITKYERIGALLVPQEVAVIHVDENPLAATRPGVFSDYWITLDNGLIFVGVGPNPGENIFLTWRDPTPQSDIRRIGFGTNMTGVVYTEVKVRPPIKSIPPTRKYFPSEFIQAQPPTITAKNWGSTLFVPKTTAPDEAGSAEWSAFPLRVPGRGSFSVNLNGTKETAVIISASKDTSDDFYAIIFGAEGNDGIRIKKHLKGESSYTTLASVGSKFYNALNLSPTKMSKFWVSITRGQILVGMGNIGENIVLGTQDLLPLLNVFELGFVSNSGETGTYTNLNITSPVALDITQEETSYQRTANQYVYSGSVYIVLPFEYQIDQEGQAVKFMDKIGGQTFYPGATPQQDAKYFFMITVQPNGFPQLDWVTEPENKQMIELQKKITIKQTLAESLASAGQSVSGSGMIGGIIGTVASMAFAGASAGVGAEVGKQKAELGAYRDASAYVYTDKMSNRVLGNASVPPEAQANALEAKSKMDLGGKWTPSSTEKYERLISLYQQVVYLVNHPYVVQDPSIKPNLFSSITALYKARQVLYPGIEYEGAQAAYNSLLSLLISAHDNIYLINPDKPDEAKQKDIWYTWINELSRDLLANHAEKPVDLQPFHGEYIWLSFTLEKLNSGIVSFEAKGLSDIFVAFGQSTFKTRNTNNEIYEINLGGFENTRTVIRVQSLDTPIAQFTREEKPDAMLDSLDFKRFWIILDNGKIMIGTGAISETNKVLEWRDIYPIQRLKYVGLSTWNAPISFRNIHVGPFSDFAAAAKWDPANKKEVPKKAPAKK
ncbi:hypothetical protein FJ366_02790 [Candidatus Dependentiae bacterium]|nr:hypothetical protein [Candidatus Dependentiae bacterium]